MTSLKDSVETTLKTVRAFCETGLIIMVGLLGISLVVCVYWLMMTALNGMRI